MSNTQQQRRITAARLRNSSHLAIVPAATALNVMGRYRVRPGPKKPTSRAKPESALDDLAFAWPVSETKSEVDLATLTWWQRALFRTYLRFATWCFNRGLPIVEGPRQFECGECGHHTHVPHVAWKEIVTIARTRERALEICGEGTRRFIDRIPVDIPLPDKSVRTGHFEAAALSDNVTVSKQHWDALTVGLDEIAEIAGNLKRLDSELKAVDSSMRTVRKHVHSFASRVHRMLTRGNR